MTQIDFEKLKVGDVFKSRKNRVFRIKYKEDTRVAKVYPTGDAETARKEFRLLTDCSELGLRVPKPIELSGNTIIMTYLEGVNLADTGDRILQAEEMSNAANAVPVDQVADGLADWLASFHRAFGFELCRGDTILRNFLESSGSIYGFDFEEAHKGDPILDLGELCAHILGMRPLFGSRNALFASEIVARYWKATGEDRSHDLQDSIALGLEHYAKFRGDGKVLEEWARKFRQDGIDLLEQLGAKV